MRSFLPSALMTLLGLATAAIVITLLVCFERYTAGLGTAVRVHAYLLFWVVPAPAIILSWLACSGYWLGARVSHYRPGGLVLINILVFAAVVFLATYWLEYAFVLQPFGLIESKVGFGEFLRRIVLDSEVTLTTKGGRGGRQLHSGWLGVAVSLLILGGYLFGGFALYEAIRAMPCCPACGQFMRSRGRQVRYPADPAAIETTRGFMRRLRRDFDERELTAMLDHHAGQARERRLKERRWRSILRHKECAACGADCLEHQASRFGRGGWTADGDKLQIFPQRRIRLAR